MRHHPEDHEQRTLIAWCRWNAKTIPELALVIHIPNGGRRGKIEAARLQGLGVRAGVSDLFLPVARDGFHGLWIEMKAPGARGPTATQQEWIELMQDQGYRACVSYGYTEARSVIEDYLKSTIPCGAGLSRTAVKSSIGG